MVLCKRLVINKLLARIDQTNLADIDAYKNRVRMLIKGVSDSTRTLLLLQTLLQLNNLVIGLNIKRTLYVHTSQTSPLYAL